MKDIFINDIIPNKIYKLNYPNWNYYVFIPINKFCDSLECYVCCHDNIKQKMFKGPISFLEHSTVQETDLSEFDWAEEFKLFCL